MISGESISQDAMYCLLILRQVETELHALALLPTRQLVLLYLSMTKEERRSSSGRSGGEAIVIVIIIIAGVGRGRGSGSGGDRVRRSEVLAFNEWCGV